VIKRVAAVEGQRVTLFSRGAAAPVVLEVWQRVLCVCGGEGGCAACCFCLEGCCLTSKSCASHTARRVRQ
jgi:hypothetical protein